MTQRDTRDTDSDALHRRSDRIAAEIRDMADAAIQVRDQHATRLANMAAGYFALERENEELRREISSLRSALRATEATAPTADDARALDKP